MGEVAKSEQDIYNIYLRVIAKAQGRPYKYKKNFDDFDSEKHNEIIRLSIFFERFPHIDIETFLYAPYNIWPDTKYIPLNFYNKRKALKVYITYKKKLINLPPDDIYQLRQTLNSFRFIKRFCKSKDIHPRDYIDHKDGCYSFLNHLKNGNVNIYALFEYDSFRSIMKNEVDSELKEFLYGDMYIDYDIMYRKFLHSKKCKEITKKALISISK